jgi:plastocyanin
MKAGISVAVFLLVPLLGACGGGAGDGGGSGTCTPGSTASIRITSSGVSPTAVCVLPGGTVTFTNNDSAAHDIESGATCTELNLGSIAAAQSKSATLPTVEVCPFHDAGAPSNMAFQGTVAVTSAPAQGPGY